MVGTSDPDEIKKLEGFCKDEKVSSVIDKKGRTVVMLKKSLSKLNEAVEKKIEVEAEALEMAEGKI